MQSDRRHFFKGCAAVLFGGIAILAPLGAALSALLDPLRHKTQGQGDWVRIAALDAIPDDDVPRKFSVIADQVDAWNKTPNVAIGAVYLRRSSKNEIFALNVVCPHAGGLIDYISAGQCFLCPLHKSLFKADGSIKDAKSPSPRPMDSLPVAMRDGAVWVQFENFRVGVSQKIPA